jgi:methylmalonyl-CoA/ethylmalonyl-CoA epimerase
MDYQLDHVAVGVPRVGEAAQVVAGELGALPYAAGPGPGFRWWQYRFHGGAVLELLEPDGPPDGFLHRFLEQRGPGVHHVTFKVPEIRAAMERAGSFGYRVVGFNDFGDWKEAFLHPKQAQGIVVQLAQQEGSDDGVGLDTFPPVEARGRPPATLRSVRLTARDEGRARRQWEELLGGRAEPVHGGLVFRWPKSPLAVQVDVDPSAAEGVRALELSSDTPLPESPHPVLGTVLQKFRNRG